MGSDQFRHDLWWAVDEDDLLTSSYREWFKHPPYLHDRGEMVRRSSKPLGHISCR